MARKKNKKNRNNKNNQTEQANNSTENSVVIEASTNNEEELDTSFMTTPEDPIDSVSFQDDAGDGQVAENSEVEIKEEVVDGIESDIPNNEDNEVVESNVEIPNDPESSKDQRKDDLSHEVEVSKNEPLPRNDTLTSENATSESAVGSKKSHSGNSDTVAQSQNLNGASDASVSNKDLIDPLNMDEDKLAADENMDNGNLVTEDSTKAENISKEKDLSDDNDSFELDITDAEENVSETNQEDLDLMLNDDQDLTSLTSDQNAPTEVIEHTTEIENGVRDQKDHSISSDLDTASKHTTNDDDLKTKSKNHQIIDPQTILKGDNSQPTNEHKSNGQFAESLINLNAPVEETNGSNMPITSTRQEIQEENSEEATTSADTEANSSNDAEVVSQSNNESNSVASIKERETTNFSFEDVSLNKEDDKFNNSTSLLGTSSSELPALPPRDTNNSQSEETQSNTQTKKSFIPPILPLRHKEEKKSNRTVNAVPPPLSEEMRSPEFRKHFEQINKDQSSILHRRSNRLSTSTPVGSPVESATADLSLIANRLRISSVKLDEFNPAVREDIQNGIDILKTSFSQILLQGEDIHKNIVGAEEEVLDEEEAIQIDEIRETDWSFWTKVVNEFSVVANTDSDRLEKQITNGIPRQIRGIIWQLIANSKSSDIDDIYNNLLNSESPHEAAIKRDLNRTNFIPDNKIDSLYNILKVYSVYDPAVGYTQGMAFMATPLLLTCDLETEAFGLLVSLMKSYNLRDFYLSGMPGLMLMLYQFDRLLEENSPRLANHLTREGIRSTMYTTQWFLTMFTYKFPYEFVLRIYDIIMFEGLESLLKFAVNIMIKNEDKILELKFDKLLSFLKDELFEYYSNIENGNNKGIHDQFLLKPVKLERTNSSRSISNKQTDILANKSYNVNLFITDAMSSVHFTPLSLNRYEQEYESIQNLEKIKENELDKMKIKNEQLQREKDKLEHDFNILNEEHINMAKELIQNRLTIETIMDENNDLQSTIDKLQNEIDEEIKKNKMPNPDAELPINLKQDLERTMKRNEEVTALNAMLQNRLKEIDRYIVELKQINKTFKPGNNSNTTLHQEDSEAVDSEESKPVHEGKSDTDVADDGPIKEIRLDEPASHENKIASGFSSGWSGFKKVFKK